MRIRGCLTLAAGLAVALISTANSAEAGLFRRRAEVVYVAPTAYVVPTAAAVEVLPGTPVSTPALVPTASSVTVLDSAVVPTTYTTYEVPARPVFVAPVVRARPVLVLP